MPDSAKKGQLTNSSGSATKSKHKKSNKHSGQKKTKRREPEPASAKTIPSTQQQHSPTDRGRQQRLLGVLHRLRKLATAFAYAADSTCTASNSTTTKVNDNDTEVATDAALTHLDTVRPTFGDHDEEFSDFLDHLGEKSRNSSSAERTDIGPHQFGQRQLQFEEDTVWHRLSYLNDATVRYMKDILKQKSAHGEKSEFKDSYAVIVSHTFTEDLEALQKDKFLQELGMEAGKDVGLELLALALETGHTTHEESHGVLLQESLKQLGQGVPN